MSPRPTDPALSAARREAGIVFLTWLAAMLYTVLYSYRYGYGRTAEDLTYVLGFPDWVFWGIVVPWGTCIAFSLWFGAKFMRDEELLEDDASDEAATHRDERSE